MYFLSKSYPHRLYQNVSKGDNLVYPLFLWISLGIRFEKHRGMPMIPRFKTNCPFFGLSILCFNIIQLAKSTILPLLFSLVS